MRVPVLLTLPAVVLAFAACGGGGDEDDGDAAATYRKQARDVCIQGDRESSQLEAPTKQSAASVSDYFERLLDANQRTIDRFTRLDPPEDLKPAHDRLLVANREAVAEVRRLIEKIEGGTEPTEAIVAARGRLDRIRVTANQATNDLGVPECGAAES